MGRTVHKWRGRKFCLNPRYRIAFYEWDTARVMVQVGEYMGCPVFGYEEMQ